MKLLLLCPRWGQEHLPLEVFFETVKSAGYDGVEMWMPEAKSERKKIPQLLDEFDLVMVGHQHQANGNSIESFCRSFYEWLQVSAESNPLFINSHSGRDYFSLDEQLKVLDVADEFSAKTNVAVAHETHRGRMFFCPSNAAVLMEQRPRAQVTADLSHWVCVAENGSLKGFEPVVEKLIQQSKHIHARVGFEEGPQVPDPRLPEYEGRLAVFLAWWKAVIKKQKERGFTTTTITTEFGPPPYMWPLPVRDTVKEQWELNLYMKDLLRKEFANLDKQPIEQ